MKTYTCDECGENKEDTCFEQPLEPKPHCKECQQGFWSEMGDDPTGRNWE